MLGAIALDGVRVATEIEGSLDGPRFVTWLSDELGPTLRPGDIVVLDGPSIHRVEGVEAALAAYGAKAMYLPPYSPELNPIEMCWAWLKSWIRKWIPRGKVALVEAIRLARTGVTASLCASWIRHSGYPLVALARSSLAAA